MRFFVGYLFILRLKCAIMSLFFCNFVQNLDKMANELQDTLARIVGKSTVMVEKYHALTAAKEITDKDNAELRAENERLRIEIERVKRENEYLRMAHAIAPTPESVAQSKNMISKIVRDIDKCINQLNA